MTVTVPVLRHRFDKTNPDNSGHVYRWAVCDSPTRETYPVGAANGDKHGTIRWEPGGLYADRKVTHLRRAFRVLEGSPARSENAHNQPADAPDGYEQTGVDGSYRTGVSPVAFDWKQGEEEDGRSGLLLVLQPQERGSFAGSPYGNRKHWTVIPDAEMVLFRTRQEWIVYEAEITWGLASTTPAGAVKVWRYRDGVRDELPVIDINKVNTRWLNQGMVTLWEGGGYWDRWAVPGMPSPCVTEAAPTQLGRTRQEMLADKPTFYDTWGTGTSVPAGTFTYPDGDSPDPGTMPLTVLAKTSTKITYGWTPVPGRGYTFWTNGVLRSRTNNPDLAQTSFSRKVGDVNEVRALVDGPQGKHTQT